MKSLILATRAFGLLSQHTSHNTLNAAVAAQKGTWTCVSEDGVPGTPPVALLRG